MADCDTLVLNQAIFGHHGKAPLFSGLSMRVPRGGFCAVLGPNGTGKTTLMQCITGQYRLGGGEIRRPGQVGYVPQTLDLLFDFSVIDIVIMGRLRKIPLLGAPRPSDWQAARAALDRVGMADFAERGFVSLSGGERQLVLLARALAGEPPLILLDEPMAALDIANQDLVLRVLLDLQAGGGPGIVMTTHDPQHAVLLADHVLLLHGDGASSFGTATEMLTEQRLSALYGVPIVRHIAPHSGGHSVMAPVPPESPQSRMAAD